MWHLFLYFSNLWGYATNKDKRWLILYSNGFLRPETSELKVIVGNKVWTGYIVFQFIVSYPVLFCFFHHWQWEGLQSTRIYNIPALIQWWSNKYLLFSNIDKITFFFFDIITTPLISCKTLAWYFVVWLGLRSDERQINILNLNF